MLFTADQGRAGELPSGYRPSCTKLSILQNTNSFALSWVSRRSAASSEHFLMLTCRHASRQAHSRRLSVTHATAAQAAQPWHTQSHGCRGPPGFQASHPHFGLQPAGLSESKMQSQAPRWLVDGMCKGSWQGVLAPVFISDLQPPCPKLGILRIGGGDYSSSGHGHSDFLSRQGPHRVGWSAFWGMLWVMFTVSAWWMGLRE